MDKKGIVISIISGFFFIAAFIILSMLLSKDTDGCSNPASTVNTAKEELSATDCSDTEIDMDDIYLNELVSGTDNGRIYPNPEECVNVVWEEKDIIAYYGNHLVPPYIPSGLQESPQNGTQEAVFSNTGEIWEDTVWLNFFHDYYDDGSPKLTEDISAVKGFYLNASKIGLLTNYCITGTANEIKASKIGKTSVFIGYQSMEYGPYDSDTHKPSGYYDMYVFQFALNGIEYELVFSQIELEEAVKVVSSIIYGKNM